MKLEIVHADTCLPDYWSGHHKAHLQIPVWHGMSLKAIKDDLKSEIRQGAIAGSDDLAYLLGSGLIKPEDEDRADKAIKAVYAAINRMKPNRRGQRRFFTELEKETDDSDYTETVYAFFVITEIE